jgi:[glutamine synthetase] adenylyltransferase / [glutamine synthetase]-adenylyl-L-tyrosine phosphorylase
MQNQVWRQAIESSADPARAKSGFDQLRGARAAASLKKISAEQARILAALFSGSQALGELLVKHPEWLTQALDADLLRRPRQDQGLRREVNSWLKPALAARDYPAALARLREFKQREMLRLAARDLARLGDVTEITHEISCVADVCLEAVYQVCRRQFTERFGQPYHLDADDRWQPTCFCILGLGKLGGQELNYSSDVDLAFVYTEEGHVFKEPPSKVRQIGKGLANHQFFKRLIEAFVAEVTRLAPEGALYRIDLRLRPEGDAGPLARSLAGYENYYAQWGQTWERMMLVKARRVAGDESLSSEFLEMIQPFRYPRSLAERILREIAEMKERTENEVVKAGEIDRNVKLGRGGIREIEFIAQTCQLLNAGRMPFLQNPQTLPALEKLVQYKVLPGAQAIKLAEAYRFLREVEHRLQMEDNLQTHTIPTERKARERLARLMGFASLRDFESALRRHTQAVRENFDGLLKAERSAPPNPLPRDLAGHQAEWRELLSNHSFRDTAQSLRLVETLALGPGYVHVSPRTTDLAMQLVTKLLARCPKRDWSGKTTVPPNPLSDPDRVLARLDSYISAYGARSMLYETWTSNPSLFDLLLLLFDRSEFLAEVAIRTPDLVDDLELSGYLRRRKTAAEILEDLRHGREDEDQRLWLRRYHRAELMRIGLRDILGLADFEQNLVELSALADACLQYALELVARKYKFKTPPLVIMGFGKLGGMELNYGSDLDITFVSDSGRNDLPVLQRVAAEVMELLASPTELGTAFVTDARLRPDGEKGLLVNTLDAYEDYYRRRAMLWEIQCLTRARPIAGNLELGELFQQLAAALTNFSRHNQRLAAYQPGWKQEIGRMRARIEKELTAPGKDSLAIKTGAGGLVDAEFIAQALCLEHGWQEANTLRALQLARDKKALPLADADSLIENYRILQRIECILRRWSFEGEAVLPDDPAPLYRVAIRCGFAEERAFLNAVTKCRAAIRAVYSTVFAAG